MSEHIHGKEQLPDKPKVGEIRKLVDDASEILEREVLEGKTRTYFDEPSTLIKRSGLEASGETTPATVGVVETRDGNQLVIDKSYDQVRNPYLVLSILERHIAGERVYATETVLRIERKTFEVAGDNQPLPADATAVWVELLDENNKKVDLSENQEPEDWSSDDAESRELDRETFELFQNALDELKLR